MDDKLLSVITVTYNNGETIKEYLNSLEKFLPKNAEVIVVDNNSEDWTVGELEKDKNILLIKSSRNLGFSKANNMAVGKAQGKYLFFLNPDTKVLDDAINKLLEFAQSHENMGIVAPKLVEPSGKVQPSVRRLPSIFGAIKEYYLGVKKSFEPYVPQGDQVVDVESVVGGAMLIKRELFNKVGGFNEKYFLYFEDLELCRQVKKLGYKVYYLPDVAIIHRVGSSISRDKLKWIRQSEKLYHGFVKYLILYLILRPRHLLRKF